jgi:hypothetical protein
MCSITSAPYSLLQVSEYQLCAWFGQAGIGDTLTYHRGCLAHDRSPATSHLSQRDRAELACVARRALALAKFGLAELTQRRLGPDFYEYLIVVKARPCSHRDMPAKGLAAWMWQQSCSPLPLKDQPSRRLRRQNDVR